MQFEEDVQGYLDWIGAAEDISDDEDNEGKDNGKESSKFNLICIQFKKKHTISVRGPFRAYIAIGPAIP